MSWSFGLWSKKALKHMFDLIMFLVPLISLEAGVKHTAECVGGPQPPASFFYWNSTSCSHAEVEQSIRKIRAGVFLPYKMWWPRERARYFVNWIPTQKSWPMPEPLGSRGVPWRRAWALPDSAMSSTQKNNANPWTDAPQKQGREVPEHGDVSC